MIKTITLFLIISVSNLFATTLSLDDAIDILKKQNLEIKAALLDVKSANADADSISGMNWGKLDFMQDFARSNDAGNVFGFKLTSREASFGDFGFAQFDNTNPNILNVQPNDLNYPDSRNFYQSKLKYEIPLFTGFAISSYSNIKNAMIKMKTLEKEQIVNEKIYEIRKTFYDMALLDSSTKNLNTILTNINILENTTKTMIEVGYAKNIDLLEVKSKKGNIQRLLMNMDSNKKLLYHYISFLLNQKVTTIQTPQADLELPDFTTEEILLKNLDIQKAQTGLNIQKNMLSASQASYYPTLGAFGEVATADDTFLGDASDHQAYTVGARLTWNIFNGGIDSSNVEKSRVDFLKAQTQVQLAQNGINLKIQKIKTEIQTADQEISSLKTELLLANVIYKNYEGRYKEKLSSMSDVIVKQSQQIQKILELQVAKNKRNQKVFALEKLANGEQK